MPTMQPVRALSDRSWRMPEAGRIRLGRKVPTSNGKSRPDKLTTLRFTSQRGELVAAAAAKYGGAVAPWQNGNHQEWEVVTEASEVPVVLPSEGALGAGPSYELYSGGGLLRRCDGEWAVCPQRVSDDEVAMEKRACICLAKGVLECKPTIQLSVILPELPFAGTWRVVSHSWNALEELPGMVEAVRQFTARRFVRAFLGLRQEERMEAGKKKEFCVPYLRLDTSVNEALEGGAALDAIPASPAFAEIGAGAPVTLPVIEAKQRLLDAMGGDKQAAAEAWAKAGFRVDPAPANAVVEVERLEQLIAEVGIADAELIEDDDPGRPF